MKEAIDAVNLLVEKRVIDKYAVAGAVAALYYIEPTLTQSLDILVAFAQTGSLVTLKAIYDALAALGYAETRNEGVVIGGWPVQFIPVADKLDSEALDQAEEVHLTWDGSAAKLRVLRAEHVVATALRVGRPKDYARISEFIAQEKVDLRRLAEVLQRHRLRPKWDQFCMRFTMDNPLR